MLFLIIENVRNGDPAAVGWRFRERGRMLPDGVLYQASWIDPVTARCYQIMEAPDRASLTPWIDAWSDLVDFDIIPVLTSSDYWAQFQSHTRGATAVDPIDIDEIAEINFPDPTGKTEPQSVEVLFKDGKKKTYTGPDLTEVMEILNHWTPPTA
jgi:hypothetical protein